MIKALEVYTDEHFKVFPVSWQIGLADVMLEEDYLNKLPPDLKHASRVLREEIKKHYKVPNRHFPTLYPKISRLWKEWLKSRHVASGAGVPIADYLYKKAESAAGPHFTMDSPCNSPRETFPVFSGHGPCPPAPIKPKKSR